MRLASRCRTSLRRPTFSKCSTCRAFPCVRSIARRTTRSCLAVGLAFSTPSRMRRSSTRCSSAKARSRCPRRCSACARGAARVRRARISCARSRRFPGATFPRCIACGKKRRRSARAHGSSRSSRAFPSISRSACSRASRKALGGSRASFPIPSACTIAFRSRCCVGARAGAASARPA